MKKEPLIEDKILTSPTNSVSKIDGDKEKIDRAILSLEGQGFIEVIYDEQSNPISFTVTKKGKLLTYNGGYQKWKRKQWLEAYKDNIAQFIANVLSKSFGVIIVLAICKAIS